MKNLKITHGKWIYRTGSVFDSPSVVVNTGNGILTIANCSTKHLREAAAIAGETLPEGFTTNNDEANAKLISKAPELLSMLEKCYRFINRGANLHSQKERYDLEKEIESIYSLASGIEL